MGGQISRSFRYDRETLDAREVLAVVGNEWHLVEQGCGGGRTLHRCPQRPEALLGFMGEIVTPLSESSCKLLRLLLFGPEIP